MVYGGWWNNPISVRVGDHDLVNSFVFQPVKQSTFEFEVHKHNLVRFAYPEMHHTIDG